MEKIPITVREAASRDLALIVSFNRAMALETEGKTLDAKASEDGVRRALADPARAMYFMAESGGEVVGQAMITTEWSDWRDGYFWWFQSVYVKPGHRCKGVFRSLYQHIRALAHERGDVCGLRLYVDRDNKHAIETYERLGMVITNYHLCEEDWTADDVQS